MHFHPILFLFLDGLGPIFSSTYVQDHFQTFLAVVDGYSDSGIAAGGAKREPPVITAPKLPYLFTVPFTPDQDLDPLERDQLRALCTNWLNTINHVLGEILSDKFNDNPNTGDNTDLEKKEESCMVIIPQEYSWWKARFQRLETLKQQITTPLVLRAVSMMKESVVITGDDDQQVVGGDPETFTTASSQAFWSKFKIIEDSMDEAMDNMKFLDGIKKQVEILLSTTDFRLIRRTLRKVMKCLRYAWMLSKHYNTDEKMIGLIGKITGILRVRVRHFVQLQDLNANPDRAQEMAENSLNLLMEWEDAFHSTRLDIEQSGREKRWEFSVQEIFDPVKHAKKICSDIQEVSVQVQCLRVCYSQHFLDCTSNVKAITDATTKITELANSFGTLTFEIFSPTNLHHWENHINWLNREIKFLEVRSVQDSGKIFECLVSSQLAFKAVTTLLEKDHNKYVAKSIFANIGKAMKKYTTEICENKEYFLAHRKSPPLPGDLPPISGSICWADNILSDLKLTLQVMTAIPMASEENWSEPNELYRGFCAQLEAYKQSQYEEWCCKVSDILSQNLTRTLLLVDRVELGSIQFYKVNFTSDLSDTLAEVKHLERLGFKVPDVARNMSIQESRLTGVANDLRAMVDKYHTAIDSLSVAEKHLMRSDIELVNQGLRPGYSRLTWNYLAIPEFLLAGNNCISVLKSKIQQITLIRAIMAKCVHSISIEKLLR